MGRITCTCILRCADGKGDAVRIAPILRGGGMYVKVCCGSEGAAITSPILLNQLMKEKSIYINIKREKDTYIKLYR